ncbi:MAG: cysteine desulfurase [Deltaproteobacteria bacterium]|nr:cysteine desulfurase [Deltaproteobacteria bacterium]
MIYLDHNATSPLLPEVLEAMGPWLGTPANPASAHRAGQAAAAEVERAREHIATLVGGNPAGVVITSGATEANHTFLRGVVQQHPGRVVLSAIEHPSVLAAAEVGGGPVQVLDVQRSGVVRVPDLPPDTAVLSLMAANHETGVIQPLDQGRAATRAVGAALHVDATQAAGRIPLHLDDADGVVLSAHKLGGPGGVGALVLPDGAPFPPLLTGGSQERGRRAGTVHTAGAVGFGEACRLAHLELTSRRERWGTLSARIRARLRAIGARLVGDPDLLLPNTTCVVFPTLLGESLVQALDLRGVCVSSGAACASGSLEPSPVLLAMGDPEPQGALRISLGPQTTPAEVDAFLQVMDEVLETIRSTPSFR